MDGIEDAAGRTNPENQRARKKLYERMRRHNLAPLWEVLHDILRPAPASPCAPALWRYTEMRPYLLEAGNTNSGAACCAALAVARRLGRGKVVATIFCDAGGRYLTTDLFRSEEGI